MSSDILARVEALSAKAEGLAGKGHALRAAENFGRAAEAARALGADNFVALHMELRQGNMLGGYAMASQDDTADLRIRAGACRAECIALLSGAVEALERRRLAGTLQEGKCAAFEEAWLTASVLRLEAVPAAFAASWAALVGYEQFMRAAVTLSRILLNAGPFAVECSYEQFQSFAYLVVHAAEMMQQPRRHGDVLLEHEWDFSAALRNTVALGSANGLDARLVQLLAAASQRLQRSGVLQARRIEQSTRFDAPAVHAFHLALQKSMTAPGLRSCALPGCGAKEAHPTHFKSCAACRAVVYCCREHQVAGWPGHKKACKAARKAAAAEEDGAGPSGA